MKKIAICLYLILFASSLVAQNNNKLPISNDSCRYFNTEVAISNKKGESLDHSIYHTAYKILSTNKDNIQACFKTIVQDQITVNDSIVRTSSEKPRKVLSRVFRNITGKIYILKINKDNTFSDSIAKYSNIFDDLFEHEPRHLEDNAKLILTHRVKTIYNTNIPLSDFEETNMILSSYKGKTDKSTWEIKGKHLLGFNASIKYRFKIDTITGNEVKLNGEYTINSDSTFLSFYNINGIGVHLKDIEGKGKCSVTISRKTETISNMKYDATITAKAKYLDLNDKEGGNPEESVRFLIKKDNISFK